MLEHVGRNTHLLRENMSPHPNPITSGGLITLRYLFKVDQCQDPHASLALCILGPSGPPFPPFVSFAAKQSLVLVMVVVVLAVAFLLVVVVGACNHHQDHQPGPSKTTSQIRDRNRNRCLKHHWRLESNFKRDRNQNLEERYKTCISVFATESEIQNRTWKHGVQTPDMSNMF